MITYATGAPTGSFVCNDVDKFDVPRALKTVRFTPDKKHVIVTCCEGLSIRMFTLDGVCVRVCCPGLVTHTHCDMVFTACGELVVSDVLNHRICVYADDCVTLLREWQIPSCTIAEGGDQQQDAAAALCIAGRHLYVSVRAGLHVYVYE